MRKIVIKVLILVGVLAAVVLTAPVWKPWAKQFKWVIITTNIGQDLLRRSGLATGQIGQADNFTRLFSDSQAELNRTEKMFQDYLRYSGLSGDALRGKRVLELGPGFNIMIPLQFLAAGAEQAVAVDRFVPFQTTPYAQKLYQMERERLSADARERFDAAITLTPTVALKPDRMTYLYGGGIEDVEKSRPPGSFDVILSNAVLEEIYEIDSLFQSMDRLLAPGGYLLHKIDLGDYGMFTKHGFAPLEFLTVPDSVYRYMVESSGQPNRHLINYYRDKLSSLGYSADLYVTNLIGGKAVDPPVVKLQRGVHYDESALRDLQAIRPRLLERYRELPDEDLLAGSIFLVGRKAPAAQAGR